MNFFFTHLFLSINIIFVNALVKDIETYLGEGNFAKAPLVSESKLSNNNNSPFSPLSLKSNKKSQIIRRQDENMVQNKLNCQSRDCIINFGVGPAQIPETVLQQYSRDLFNFKGNGVGINELSQFSEAFKHGILEKAKEAVYELSGYSKED